MPAVAALSCLLAGDVTQAATNGLALSPPLGWTSWSSLKANVDEEAVKVNARIQAALLRQSGYVYVNVDGGWYRNPDAEVDAFGRWVPDATKFPSGMAALGDYIHSLGLKFGLYVTPGIPAIAVYLNRPIEGTPYHAPDIAITTRQQQTYLGGTMYYIDYAAPGAQAFVNSWANLFASWGIDYLKLDAVGTWNIPDIQAWSAALRQTGRPIHLALSNDLDPAHAAIWNRYANGWRISPDIEAYDGVGLTTWDKVALRFVAAPRWLGVAGSGGWNDLDSLTVGGSNTGLTRDERQTMATLWALSASPLIVGDDLRTLDAFGLDLLTNPEAIGINQAGVVAAPLDAGSARQVWRALQPDGSYVVGLFNLGPAPAEVSVSWTSLGFSGAAAVRDVWARSDLGSFATGFGARLDPHASLMLRVTPAAPVQLQLASTATTTAWAFVGRSAVAPRGERAQYVGFGSGVVFPRVAVTSGAWYRLTIQYINGDAQPRGALMTVNGTVSWFAFPAAGDWGANTTAQGFTTIAYLAAGDNTIAFSNPAGWAPDIVGITIQPLVHGGPVRYRVISVQTGRVLGNAFSSTLPGTPVIQSPATGGTNQEWEMAPQVGGPYVLVNRFSGQALDVFDASLYPGAPLIQWPSSGGPSQRWRVVSAGNGACVLVNEATGLVARASPDWDGAKVDQWYPTGTVDQHWIVVPVM